MPQTELFSSTPAPPARDIYTVTRLNREARELLEGRLPLLWIDGEISNLARPASGHLYFSLKDARAQVHCAWFRSAMRAAAPSLKDGARVLLRARVSLYEPRGDFQLIVEHLEDAGEGALRLAFEQLKQRLMREGLFDATRKRPLPRLPRRIGLITSPSGAVVHDILTTLRRRFPAIAVTIYPVPVQGDTAAEQIVQALAAASARRDCDALILARGGGSLEDLRAFNEESVARAIHASSIPVVSAVGHETDFTIADFVADARAPTPTAAAEMLSPDGVEWMARAGRLERRLLQLARDGLRQRAQHLDWLTARMQHPRARIAAVRARLRAQVLRLQHARIESGHRRQRRLERAVASLRQMMPGPRLHLLQQRRQHLGARLLAQTQRALERAHQRSQRSAQALHTLSPLATLARGYAVVERSGTGELIRAATSLRAGERVRARLARGEIECIVEKTRDA